jgi:hypothetical protein
MVTLSHRVPGSFDLWVASDDMKNSDMILHRFTLDVQPDGLIKTPQGLIDHRMTSITHNVCSLEMLFAHLRAAGYHPAEKRKPCSCKDFCRSEKKVRRKEKLKQKEQLYKEANEKNPHCDSSLCCCALKVK